jgi:CheY-like chemotaxis protein
LADVINQEMRHRISKIATGGQVRKRILIVEDTKTIVMVEKLMLSGQDYEIETASNGLEGLMKAQNIKPDLVLLDIMMPEMDGIEMCRQLKANSETKSIPVVMVTTKGESDKVEQAFLAGCDDYVTKPIDKVELRSKVAKHLGKA